jgi:hypothetical protein
MIGRDGIPLRRRGNYVIVIVEPHQADVEQIGELNVGFIGHQSWIDRG